MSSALQSDQIQRRWITSGKQEDFIDIHSLPKTIWRTRKMHCNLREVTKETPSSVLHCDFVLLIFLLSSHFFKRVCVTLEAHQRLRLWVCNELMEKEPQCAGKRKPFFFFVCQEHYLFFLFFLHVVISQTLHYSFAFVQFWHSFAR